MLRDKDDKKIFLEILDSYNKMIYKFCWMFSNNTKENFEDLYQQVCYNLWKFFKKNKDRQDSNWVYRITLNTVIDYGRKKKLIDKVFEKLNITHEIADQQEDSTRKNVLYELISRLSSQDKVLIGLYLEKYSYEKIAEKTNITVTNVGTRIQRIKEKLRKLKVELYGDEEF